MSVESEQRKGASYISDRGCSARRGRALRRPCWYAIDCSGSKSGSMKDRSRSGEGVYVY